MSMHSVQKTTEEYARARRALADKIGALNAAIDEVKARHMRGIQQAIIEAGAARKVLIDEINANRGVFAKPKTRVIESIKVGLAKGTGRIEFDDEQKVIERIRARFVKSIAEAMINKTEKVNKSALNDLSAEDLKAIGVRIEGTGDQVVVKPTDSDLDKLINALVGDAVAIAQESAA